MMNSDGQGSHHGIGQEMTAVMDAVAEVPDMEVLDELRVADRCDRCTAQAFVRIAFGESLLDFCGHHYAEHEAAIAAQGGHILQDKRDDINTAASMSAY